MLLLVIATVIMGQTLHARADEATVTALGPGQLSVPAAHGTLTTPSTSTLLPAGPVAPMARVLTDAATTPARHRSASAPAPGLGHDGDSVAGSPMSAVVRVDVPAVAPVAPQRGRSAVGRPAVHASQHAASRAVRASARPVHLRATKALPGRHGLGVLGRARAAVLTPGRRHANPVARLRAAVRLGHGAR